MSIVVFIDGGGRRYFDSNAQKAAGQNGPRAWEVARKPLPDRVGSEGRGVEGGQVKAYFFIVLWIYMAGWIVLFIPTWAIRDYPVATLVFMMTSSIGATLFAGRNEL